MFQIPWHFQVFQTSGHTVFNRPVPHTQHQDSTAAAAVLAAVPAHRESVWDPTPPGWMSCLLCWTAEATNTISIITHYHWSISGSNRVRTILVLPNICQYWISADISISCHQRRRGRQGGCCNFPTDNSKFSTEEIMGAQNFNFAPRFPQNGVSSSKFCTFGYKFSYKKIFWQLKIHGGQLCTGYLVWSHSNSNQQQLYKQCWTPWWLSSLALNVDAVFTINVENSITESMVQL